MGKGFYAFNIVFSEDFLTTSGSMSEFRQEGDLAYEVDMGPIGYGVDPKGLRMAKYRNFASGIERVT